MTKVVLDTNVIVSAFLTPGGKPAAILESVLRNELDICYNAEIISEYEEVLCRPKFVGVISQPSIQRFFDIITKIGIRISCSPSNIILYDEKDRVFYDIAKAADAKLISGNKKHYPEEDFIFDPTEFLQHIKN